jgi:hypothetical protein
MADDDLRDWRGRRVVLDPQDYPQHPGTFEVRDARRTANGDVFVKVANGRGAALWVKSDELEPAPAKPTMTNGAATMNTSTAQTSTQRLLLMADSVRKSRKNLSYAQSLKIASLTLKDDAAAWHDSIASVDTSPVSTAPVGGASRAVAKLIADLQQRTPGMSLGEATEKVLGALLAAKLPALLASPKTSPTSTPQPKTAVHLSASREFTSLVNDYAASHGVGVATAAKAIARVRPDLAAQREAAFGR